MVHFPERSFPIVSHYLGSYFKNLEIGFKCVVPFMSGREIPLTPCCSSANVSSFTLTGKNKRV